MIERTWTPPQLWLIVQVLRYENEVNAHEAGERPGTERSRTAALPREQAARTRDRVVNSAEFFAETGIQPMRYPRLLSDRLKAEGKM